MLVGNSAIVPATVETSDALHHHRHEDDVDRNQGWPEMKMSEEGVHLATGHFRIPVIDTGEKTEDHTWCHHIVEVTDHVISVVEVEVGEVEGERQPRETTKTKHRQERASP